MSSIVTRTLLLTDIVGSTAIVEALGDEPAADLLAQVDRVVRDAVMGSRGVEIDKTDGFLIIFERAVDAVRCAMRVHEALAEISRGQRRSLQMRCGIHVGEVVLRENSPHDVAHGAKPVEVEGLAKPMAARIMSLARGGQTLLSRPAHGLARRASVGDPELKSLRYSAHGAYRLAGVSDPVEVFEVSRRRPKRPATSDKVKRVRRRSPLLWLLATLVLVGLAAAAGWTLWPQLAGYTTLSAPARVSYRPSQQARFESAWQAYGNGDLRGARRRIDAVARDLPDQPDVRLTQLAITYADQHQVPAELLAQIKGDLAGASGPDAELLAFVERWKVEGWDPQKLHDEIHGFRERHPDHLVGLLLAIDLHEEQRRSEEVPGLIDELQGSSVAMASAWRLRADEQIRRDDFGGAEATLLDGLSRFPNHPLLNQGLAVLRWEQGDAERALELLQPILTQDPSNLVAHASTVAALLALGREPEVEPHVATLQGPMLTPVERVAFSARLAESFAVEGRMARSRELLDVALAEAQRESLSDAWVDLVLQDLRWALDPDLTTAVQRTRTLERAEQALLEPWMSEVARRRLRAYVTSARAVEAWLNGDLDAARQLVPSVQERDGVADALGAVFVLRTLDDREDTVATGDGCASTLAAGEVWFHGGAAERSAVPFETAGQPTCEGRYHHQPERAAAEAHLATLAFERGALRQAAERVEAFRAIWPRADDDLPVVRTVNGISYAIAQRAAAPIEEDRSRRSDRRRKPR